MSQISAGLLMCRFQNDDLQFFLVHPGGPFYQKKNEGVWSIPKGIIDGNEELLSGAKREFFEETGINPSGDFHSLGTIRLKSGKTVHAWTFLGQWNERDGIVSNTFPMEWPPRSGKFIQVPEVDIAAWMNLDLALKMINPAQQPLLQRSYDFFTTAGKR
jgi:predicted NUDIX family NTP pyrophosphohydrolase